MSTKARKNNDTSPSYLFGDPDKGGVYYCKTSSQGYGCATFPRLITWELVLSPDTYVASKEGCLALALKQIVYIKDAILSIAGTCSLEELHLARKY